MDYLSMTAAEHISVSAYVHFLHTLHCTAQAPSLPAPKRTHLHSSFYFVFSFHMLLSSIPLHSAPSGPGPEGVSLPHLSSVKHSCANYRLPFGFLPF